MNRLTLFQTAIKDAEALRLRFPQVATLVSIIRQLEYLSALESGQTSDRSRLGEIILGVQAALEIEPLDQQLAETLYIVSEQVKSM